MGIMKPQGFDAYAYLIGTFPVEPTHVDKVENGLIGKLNTNGKIEIAGKGEKGFMIMYPNQLPKGGMAIVNASFIHGAFALRIDNKSFDDTKTYTVGDMLYVGEGGKLTNDSKISANPIAIAKVMNNVRNVGEGKKMLYIASVSGVCCPSAEPVVK